MDRGPKTEIYQVGLNGLLECATAGYVSMLIIRGVIKCRRARGSGE